MLVLGQVVILLGSYGLCSNADKLVVDRSPTIAHILRKHHRTYTHPKGTVSPDDLL